MANQLTMPTGHRAWASGQPEGALASVRAEAAARFAELGWPTTKIEAWKYTSLKAVREAPVAFDGTKADHRVDEVVDARRIEEAWAELVFVDGRLDPSRSRLPEDRPGILVRGLSAEDADAVGRLAPWQDEAVLAFNTAWLQDGLRISLEADRIVEGVVHAIHVATGAGAAAVRHVVSLGAHAKATLVESWLDLGDEDGGTTSAVVEIELADGAVLDHVVDVPAGDGARLLRSAHVRVGRDATWNVVQAWTGGALVRAETHATLADTGARVNWDAVTVLGGRSHVDQHNVFTHAAPHGTSRMRSKAVAGGRSRSVFDGTVVVREGAQKTDARQDSRNLLLSERAEADAKPRLEIYADDVACAHGATVGRLDETARTYLRTRGIPDGLARRMLTEAFVADRLQAVADEGLRDWLTGSVQTRLQQVLDQAEEIA